MRIRSKTPMDYHNAESPDKMLDDLEAKHGSRASTGSALRRVVDSVWQHSSSNFGGGSWKLTLECGHNEWRKGCQGIPKKCLCRDCKLGRPSPNTKGET